MPIRQSYEPNGMMFTSTFVLSPFMSIGQYLTSSLIFLLAPMANELTNIYDAYSFASEIYKKKLDFM